MKPLSKPLPATGRGIELGSLYDKKVQLLAVLSITQKMSSEQRISIKIHPGPNRKKLISLLLTNKFQKEDVDYVLYPEDQE